MNKLSFFLARKILFSNTYAKSISTMTTICFLGIFIGSFSLATVTAIMRGFEVAIAKKMQTIHADLTIDGRGHAINFTALSQVITAEFPEITAHSPHTNRHILINNGENNPTVAMLTAINPKTEYSTTGLARTLINAIDNNNFPKLFTHNTVIIGKQLALKHSISVGDSLELLFIREEKIKNRKVTFDTQQVTVSALFNTGVDEFDSSVLYCSFDLLEKMFPNASIEQISLSLKPHTNEKNIIQKLHNRTKLLVYSWKELYPSLIAAQKLEKYVSFFIIALILLVASMNISSLMYMHITQKRQSIALLKSMGMTNSAISGIFFIMALSISIVASCCGLLISAFLGYFLKRYPFITLPDSYYVTHLPMNLDWQIITAVFVIVLLFSLMATIIATRQIRHINISQVLRFEG